MEGRELADGQIIFLFKVTRVKHQRVECTEHEHLHAEGKDAMCDGGRVLVSVDFLDRIEELNRFSVLGGEGLDDANIAQSLLGDVARLRLGVRHCLLDLLQYSAVDGSDAQERKHNADDEQGHLPVQNEERDEDT